VQQYECCHGGYPEIADVDNGEFRMEFQ